jgi:hypothetical protein
MSEIKQTWQVPAGPGVSMHLSHEEAFNQCIAYINRCRIQLLPSVTLFALAWLANIHRAENSGRGLDVALQHNFRVLDEKLVRA